MRPSDPMPFGKDELAAWRKRMGYNTRQAPEELGCSRAAYLGWEAGRKPVPRYIGLACTALAIGVKIAREPTEEAE